MGLNEDDSRWMVEYSVHKYYTPTEEELEKYNIPSLESINEIHDGLGCIKSRAETIKFWREKLADAKDDDPVYLKQVTSLLAKSIRGHL